MPFVPTVFSRSVKVNASTTRLPTKTREDWRFARHPISRRREKSRSISSIEYSRIFREMDAWVSLEGVREDARTVLRREADGRGFLGFFWVRFRFIGFERQMDRTADYIRRRVLFLALIFSSSFL